MTGYYVIKKEPGIVPKILYYSASKANADSICEDMIIRILETFIGRQDKPQFYRKSRGGSWGKIPAHINYWITAECDKYTLYCRKYYGVIYRCWEVNKIVSVFVAKDMSRKLVPVRYNIIYNRLPQELIDEIHEFNKDDESIEK